jgi:tRNA nucleotidyltransferase (CCA-adding enzyme)
LLKLFTWAKKSTCTMDEFIERLNQPLLKRIVSLLPANIPIYLVGGAVRDALLDRQNYDLDLVTGGQALKIARHLADELSAAYYPLDVDRNVARLVIKLEENLATHSAPTIRIDISAYQGADLFGDLVKRDFTINAMAVDVHHLQELIDPLGGAADLLAKRLRACSPSALRSDPVRILRAVRFSVNLELRIMNETLQLMREATLWTWSSSTSISENCSPALHLPVTWRLMP